jgi:hypothetical protein
MPSEMDMRDIEAIKLAKRRSQGPQSAADDFETMSTFLKTHPGNVTRHEKGGVVRHENKGYKRFELGGIIK